MFDYFLSLHRKLGFIKQQQRFIMATLQETLAEVKGLRTQAAGMKAILEGVEQRVKDAAVGLSADEQATVDEIFAEAKAASADLTANMNANTPAANIDPNAAGAPATAPGA